MNEDSGPTLRRAAEADWPAVWEVVRPVLRAGDTYALPADVDEASAYRFWMQGPAATWVAERHGAILGTYYLKPNQAGPGDHVCNAGFMVAPAARRQGIARRMAEHALEQAAGMGFRAMQFNMVVSTNPALALWRELGFDVVGTLPGAFRHPREGLVDAYVMYRWLEEPS
ncbi:MAG: GNAT family N-acetyltransferase [Ectothiorhodospiraceae bacterium]